MDDPANSQPNFTGRRFANKVDGFDSPTRLPTSDIERAQWQSANKQWWESSPMRYDWRESVPFDVGTREYYLEIDRRFLEATRSFLPWKTKPFDQLLPYSQLPKLDVLEVGVGQGTHAQLIATHARSFTGIDLTEAARGSTAKRFETFGVPGCIRQMDAEEMEFDDNNFDFIWSWGVIHHSADTRRVLTEMNRVLRKDGTATVMVYHRNWWNYLVVSGALKGLVQGQLKDLGNLHRIAQAATDGAIARYYRPVEWREAVDGLFEVERIRICGLKSDVIPLPPGKLKAKVERITPNICTRAMTNGMRMGSFLVAEMRKI